MTTDDEPRTTRPRRATARRRNRHRRRRGRPAPRPPTPRVVRRRRRAARARRPPDLIVAGAVRGVWRMFVASLATVRAARPEASTAPLHEAGQADGRSTYAQVLTSIDANNVDQNFAQVLDGATGEFKDMYSKSSDQLRQLLIDNKAIGARCGASTPQCSRHPGTRSSCCCSSINGVRTPRCPTRGSTAAGSR